MAQIAYDDTKYRKGINTDYYKNAVDTYKTQAEQQRQTELADAATNRDNTLRQAYISRRQNELALRKNLAQSGIRGGATETSNLKLANQYGTARSAANTDYSNMVKSINQTYDQNIANYQSEMDSQAEQYRQNLAQAKWQAEREDATNEQNRLAEYWNNYYTNYYSGFSKKDAKAALKKAKAKAKSASGNSKIRWQQRVSAIQARLGVIANK